MNLWIRQKSQPVGRASQKGKSFLDSELYNSFLLTKLNKTHSAI